MNDPRVIVALDFADAKTALALAQRLDPQSCRVKVGKELFTAAGPQLVEKLVALGHAVFLDLKYHDIPNTVAGACRAAAALGVWMLNVHALGGRAMLEAARGALAPGPRTPRLIAVTLLTSMAQRDLAEVGLAGEPQTTVERLARLAQNCGLDGVVCSAQEVERLRAVLGGDFLLVTPGIRYSAAAADDQQRIMTPQAALAAGSDYLVVGRPVTQAADPASVVDDINRIALGMKRA